MRLWRRLLATLTLACLLAGLAALPVQSAPFDAVGHWAEREIGAALAARIASGDPDGGFRPNAPITRAEFTRLITASAAPDVEPGRPATFRDTAGHWASPYIEAGLRAGVLVAADFSNLNFLPNQPTTRQEMAVMLVRALGLEGLAQSQMRAPLAFTDASLISPQFRGHIAVAVQLGLILGLPDGRFDPAGNATRAQAVVVILRMLYRGRSILVSDTGNNRVVAITSNGTVLFSLDNLSEPHDARWLPNGNVLVTELGAGRIREMTPAGQVKWSLNAPGVHRAAPTGGHFLVTSPTQNRVAVVDTAGAEVWRYPGQAPGVAAPSAPALSAPHDAEDPPGVVAVANTGANEVLVVDRFGRLLERLTALNDGTPITQPQDVDFAGSGLLLITFGNQVALVNTAGTPVFRRTGLGGPTAAKQLSRGTFVVAEGGANRLLFVDTNLGKEWVVDRLSDGTTLSRPHSLDVYRTVDGAGALARAFDMASDWAVDWDEQRRRAKDSQMDWDVKGQQAAAAAAAVAQARASAEAAAAAAVAAAATAEAEASAAAAAEAQAASHATAAATASASAPCASVSVSVRASANAAAQAAAKAEAMAMASAQLAVSAAASASAAAEVTAQAGAAAAGWGGAFAAAFAGAGAYAEAVAKAWAAADAWAMAQGRALAVAKGSADGAVIARAQADADAAAAAYADAWARARASADALAVAVAQAHAAAAAMAVWQARAAAASAAAAEAQSVAEAMAVMAADARAVAESAAEAGAQAAAFAIAVTSGSCSCLQCWLESGPGTNR